MSVPLQSSVWSAAVAFTMLLASAPGMASDPVRASFDRMLSHGPVAAARAVALREPADPPVAAPVAPSRNGTWPGQSGDPVVASFARMLDHEPNWATPALPAGAAVDPLIAAVVWPLLRSHQITLAVRPQPAPL